MRRRRFCNTSTTKDICQQKFVCVWRGGGGWRGRIKKITLLAKFILKTCVWFLILSKTLASGFTGTLHLLKPSRIEENSTYRRLSMISKTSWYGHTYIRKGLCSLDRNGLNYLSVAIAFLSLYPCPPPM